MTSGADGVQRNPGHTYVTPQDSPDHQADFNQWNNALQQQYEAGQQQTRPAQEQNANDGQRQTLNNYPLYRASAQDPDNVFQRDGRLLTSSQLAASDGLPTGREFRTFNLVKQQEVNAPSHYSSMTTSLPAAEQFSGLFNRPNVYVTDPQPHGRYMNGQRYDTSRSDRNPAHQTASRFKDRLGSRASDGYALKRAQSYPVPTAYMQQQQVSVPGSIPSRSIRAVIPYDQNQGKLDYSQARVNEHYVSSEQYAQHEAESNESSSLPDYENAPRRSHDSY